VNLSLLLLLRLGSGLAGAAPSALDDPAYRFCHVDGANAADAAEWCELLDDISSEGPTLDLPEDRCPGLRETCAGAVAQDPQGCEPPRERSDAADGLAGAPDRPADQWEAGCDEVPGCESFDGTGLQLLLRWIAALMVAALVAVVLRVVWTTFAGRGRAARLEPASAPLPEVLDPLDDVPDIPSDDLMDRARAALDQGRHGEAVLLARAAALRRLGEAGRIRLHRSRTDREYVRAVRADAAVHRELRDIVHRAEAVRWAGLPLDRAAAAEVLGAAERLLGSVALKALGALLLGGALLWHAPAGAQSYARYEPMGDAALLDVLELHGYDAQYRLRNLIDVDDEVDVLFLDLTAISPAEAHWDHLRGWVRAGGVLVVAGDATAPFPELGALVSAPGPHEIDAAFASAGLPAPRWPTAPVGYDGEDVRDLVVTRDGSAAPVGLLDLEQGVVVAIADPRLLWNGAFVHPDNERFVGGLVYAGQSLEGWPVDTPADVQLATWASAGEPEGGDQGGCNNPVDAMAQAGLLAFLLQLAATWMLAGLWRGWPFAPLRDPPREGRASFSEHVEALGTRYWRLRASDHAARVSAALWLGRLGPHGLELAAQRGGRSPAEARAWAQQIEGLARRERDDRTPVDPALMEELWRLTRREP
jgi:hypothetical protein